MSTTPVIETPRLVLRGWREADFEPLAALLAEPATARWTTADGRPVDRLGAWRTLMQMAGQWSLKGFGMFAVEERDGGAFVGRAGPWSPEPDGGFELGWGLARAHWGRGYATEAAYAAGAWAMRQFAPARFVSLIHVDNVASQNVALRLGERPQTPTLHLGQPHVLWTIDAASWRARANV